MFDFEKFRTDLTCPNLLSVLPTEGPRITGSKAKYQVGDDVKINCTSALSKPAANLKWYINDQQAPSHYEKTYPLKILSESGLEQVTLGLHFTINSNHFLRGELRMRCTASIHRVYAMSTHAFGTLLGRCLMVRCEFWQLLT